MGDKKEKRLPNKDRIPLDGGWAWFIVFGCFLMHFLVAGLSRSYGVIFIQLRHKFQSSAGITAWIGGVCTAVRMGFSPLGTSLSNKFGTRPVVIFGGLIIGVGIFISAFTPNTEFMFFSYAILTGFGGTLAYAPSLVLTGQYFKKYRAIALGLGSAGSGVGVFTLPLLMEKMFEEYSYLGTLIIISALMLNICLCGALYRPLEANNIPRQCQAQSGVAEIDTQTESHCDHSSEGESLDTQETKDESSDARGDDKAAPKGMVENLSKYIDLTICKSKVFVVFTLALGFFTMSYMGAQMLLPAMGQSKGHEKTKSVFLLSILGISDMCGRIFSGLLFDSPFLKKHRILCYNISILIAGTCHFAWGLSTSYTVLGASSAIHGLFNGCVVSQRAVILSDLLGVENLSSSFGLTVFVQGCGLMVGPAIAGLLRDISGDYMYSYIFTGIMSWLGGLLFFLSTQSQRLCCTSAAKKNEEGPSECV